MNPLFSIFVENSTDSHRMHSPAMKKPTLVLVPPPPKAPPGEPQWIPFCGELEPLEPGQELVLIERKAPYLTCILSLHPVASNPVNSSYT